MNINKNKSIRKGFVFSRTIFPAAGALLLATQMTGCSGMSGRLGHNQGQSHYSNTATSKVTESYNQSPTEDFRFNQRNKTAKETDQGNKGEESENKTDQKLKNPNEFSKTNFP